MLSLLHHLGSASAVDCNLRPIINDQQVCRRTPNRFQISPNEKSEKSILPLDILGYYLIHWVDGAKICYAEKEL